MTPAAPPTALTRTERLPLGPAIAGIAGAVAFLAASMLNQRAAAFLSKPLPIVALLATIRWRGADRYNRWIAAGLAASLVGDVAGEMPGDHFIESLGAFLVAHVFYIVAFSTPTAKSRLPIAPLRLLPFAIGASAMLAMLAPRLGALLVPVVIYMATIVAMAWRAAARIGAAGESLRAQWAGCLGATSFVVSDSTLAVDRFHHAVHGALFIVMLTYWAAQVGIAGSTRRT